MCSSIPERAACGSTATNLCATVRATAQAGRSHASLPVVSLHLHWSSQRLTLKKKKVTQNYFFQQLQKIASFPHLAAYNAAVLEKRR